MNISFADFCIIMRAHELQIGAIVENTQELIQQEKENTKVEVQKMFDFKNKEVKNMTGEKWRIKLALQNLRKYMDKPEATLTSTAEKLDYILNQYEKPQSLKNP